MAVAAIGQCQALDEQQHPIETTHSEGSLSLPAVKVGLGVFLAVATSLFALFISAYLMRKTGPDWTTLAVPKVLWLNTGMLILGSVAMQWTRVAAQRGQTDDVKTGLMAAGVFSFAFLAGQLLAWQQLNAAGYFLTGQSGQRLLLPAHGAARRAPVGRTVGLGQDHCQVARGAKVGAIRLSVELCTVYWHYLLLVWLVLFASAVVYLTGNDYMTQPALTSAGEALPLPDGLQGIVADWSSDQRAFKKVPWGKAMMWIFLVSDTFIFSAFLISYMNVRMSTTEPWPNPSEVFALTIAGKNIPLILIAIMTFILISSSGTMAMAVKFGYEKNKKMTFILLLITAALGASFVGMQAFEWTKLISRRGCVRGATRWARRSSARRFS